MANQIESNVVPLLRSVSPRQLQPVEEGVQVKKGQELPANGNALPLEKEQKITQEKVSEAVNKLNEYVQVIRRELKFSIDENSGRTVITVVDSQTKEVIRQIPPEEVVSLSRNLGKQDSVIISRKT